MFGTALLLSVTIQFGLAWATIYNWNLVQGELAFQGTHKAFLLLAVLTQLFGVEVGDFPHPLLAFLLGERQEDREAQRVSARQANHRRSVVKVSLRSSKQKDFPCGAAGPGRSRSCGDGRKWPFLNAVCTPSLALFTSEVTTVIGGEDHESKAHVGRLQQSSRPAWDA